MKWKVLAAALLLAPAVARAGDGTAALAGELLAEGDFPRAAVEFRRLAAGAGDGGARAGWLLMAARAYADGGRFDLAASCADRAEEEGGDALEEPLSLLRADAAYGARDWASAAFHYASLGRAATNEAMRLYAAEGLAASALMAGDAGRARAAAKGAPGGEARRIAAALDVYEAVPPKKPWLGGLLGLIPGFGHFYSGEYGNGARAMALNGLFIWGMADAARNRDWGLFATAAFFELTWYSGSVYGGIDAAQRRNRARLAAAAAEIRDRPPPRPDAAALPLVLLRFEF